ncbi:L-histidine N(alpha)-methyltransferase [Sungkyunkwania multivorans]|uniref:L-histidine N(Alpha)-methyltransferase n=1 Tax=Sungkyunkwania multivorans TaxID=1173618 RepID=A0ABW3D109_9FLAO
MQSKITTIFNSIFEEDVYQGLSSYPKYLYSKYIYDEKGDELFQKIMDLPEYYLTRKEFEILSTYRSDIAQLFESGEGFDLIELGAGDGKKTKILLKELLRRSSDFTYMPIDISQNSLDLLEASLSDEFPKAKVRPQQGMYFKVLERLAELRHRKKVILMLGSNIGNLLHPKAITFLRNIQIAMNPGDLLFMGFDQKKDPQTILDAYNDKTGVTAAFNLNLLERINNDLKANFDLKQFKHWEVYDPETGTAKSYLVSLKKQEVTIEALNLNVSFDQWETIHTEISQKYDDKVVAWLANEAGLTIQQSFTDDDNWYKDYVFTKKID